MTGEVNCWGYWLTDVAPQGEFRSVSVAANHRCAVRVDGAIACWGRNLGRHILGLKSRITCGVLPNSATVCPGDEGYDLLARLYSEWANYYGDYYYHNGSAYPCGNGPDEKTVCWDPYGEAFVSPTAREVAGFSAGKESVCWLMNDGTVGCWGTGWTPEGTFQSVAVGDAVYFRDFACGVRTNGELVCWGGDGDRGTGFPPEGTFKSVSSGYIHACAIKMDNTAVCWGTIGNEYGDRGVPSPGPFRSLSDGAAGASCGVRPDDALDCWAGLHASPGAFKSVSAGFTRHGVFYCGVRTDGTLACAGTGEYGETKPPAGRFQSVSAGWRHACGVRADGTVACWGSNTDHDGEVTGQAEPPAGRFLSVSAGHEYTCGIRTDNTLSCWGQVPNVLQNLSGIRPPASTEPLPTPTPGIQPPASTEPQPTPTPDISLLPLRDQLELEKQKPGNLVANVGGDVDRIYRFVGMMTEAEREAMAEETRRYFEELGPPKGRRRDSIPTPASGWTCWRPSCSSVEEFNDYYTISEYRLKVPFYVYLPAYLPPGFRYAGVGVSGGGDYSTAWFLHFERSSETYPQLESGQEERITFVQSTNDQKGNPFRETLDKIGGGDRDRTPQPGGGRWPRRPLLARPFGVWRPGPLHSGRMGRP